MINLLIFGMAIITVISLTIAFEAMRFIIKHFSLTIDLIDKEVDPYDKEE